MIKGEDTIVSVVESALIDSGTSFLDADKDTGTELFLFKTGTLVELKCVTTGVEGCSETGEIEEKNVGVVGVLGLVAVGYKNS